MDHFLTRIRRAGAIFAAWRSSSAGPEPDELGRGIGKKGRPKRQGIVALAMQVAVSLAALVAGFYIILSGAYEAETQKWAFGVVGIVVGFWLS